MNAFQSHMNRNMRMASTRERMKAKLAKDNKKKDCTGIRKEDMVRQPEEVVETKKEKKKKKRKKKKKMVETRKNHKSNYNELF